MRIGFDPEACVGHGRCYALAPEVFSADDEGHCVVRFAGHVPPEQESQARRGVANCPEDALWLEDEET